MQSLFKAENESDVGLISPEEAQAWAIERGQGQWRWVAKKSVVYGVLGFMIWGLLYSLLNVSGRISFSWLMIFIAMEVYTFFFQWDQKEREYFQHVKNAILNEPPKETFLNFEN
jgi:hypothetical protein